MCVSVDPGAITTKDGLRFKFRVARGFSLIAVVATGACILFLAGRMKFGVLSKLDKTLRVLFMLGAVLAITSGAVNIGMWVEISTNDEGSSNLEGLHNKGLIFEGSVWQNAFRAERSEGQYGSSFGLNVAATVVMFLTLLFLEANHPFDVENEQAKEDARKERATAKAARQSANHPQAA